MKELTNLTLIAIDCKNHGGAIAALKKSLQHIKPARTVFITDRKFEIEGMETVIIESIRSKQQYSRFCIKELYKYFFTSHVLLVQADGFVINGDVWDDAFLDYDYIGAPWNFDFERQVGNGGCSIRSLKLQTVLGTDQLIDVVHPEDQSICIVYKFYLEQKYGIVFSPVELAERFSYELREPIQHTLAFHGNFWPPFQETVVIAREAALGDVIMCEPLMHYYHMKGYRVALNTLPQFYELFRAHYFPVIPFGQLNPRIPYTEINLNMAYESDPKKLHLQAYFEMAGIPKEEWEIRNPKLNFPIDHTNTLFPGKYVVIHNDIRAQPHRNIYGVDWKEAVSLLKEKGYTVIHIGKGESEDIGAIRMQTLAEPMMAYVISGAECLIGIDSGPSNVALATDRKLIIFHGSVNPAYIYPDMSKVKVITNHDKETPCCPLKYCWHESITTRGQDCIVDKQKPPCANYKTQDLLDAINEML